MNGSTGSQESSASVKLESSDESDSVSNCEESSAGFRNENEDTESEVRDRIFKSLREI
jgi:hypothetical protein